ncbi:MAG TPA: SIMPL domain-containing protein [Gaiellaceae bacterium]|nr:SIMPL domain-containing protein [Gaiellaceae bacterium]
MKKTLLLAGVLLAAAAIAGVAQPHFARSADTPTSRTITVTGNGSVSTVPDRASWYFGVDSQATTAKDALAKASSEANALIAALKDAGVADSDLQTSGISLYPQTDSDGRSIVGYQASESVSAEIAIAKAGPLVDAAVAAGADNVSGPTLSVADQSSAYDQALAKAVADAKDKAKAIAAAAGLTLGQVKSVVESGSAPTPLPFARATPSVAGDATTVAPGSQETDATVTVVFAAG